MSTLDTLRNDKDAIIAILAEHYWLDEEEIKELEFRAFDDYDYTRLGCEVIHHGEWVFCYHLDEGVLYIK